MPPCIQLVIHSDVAALVPFVMLGNTCTNGHALDELLAEMEKFMAVNDAAVDRSRKMLNITRNTGEFLAVLLQALQPAQVLEIGTSNGYSTLWLARTRSEKASPVVTVEKSEMKIQLAAENFRRAGVTQRIRQVHADATTFLRDARADTFDLIFLDSERNAYREWWTDLRRILRPGGVLIVDNATSHPVEIAPLLEIIRADPGFNSCVVPVGQGELLAVKAK